MVTTTTIATCDLCGSEIRSGFDSGGARIDMAFHDGVRVIEPTYPPIDPNLYDVCPTCRESLREWIRTRKSQCK